MTTEVYTKDVVADLLDRYKAVLGQDYEARTAVVDAVASEIGVERQSVIGKLVSEKVYVAKVTAKKETTSSKTKEDYVKALEAITALDLDSFTKAKKDQLENLFNFIVTASDEFNAAHGLQVPGDEVVTA